MSQGSKQLAHFITVENLATQAMIYAWALKNGYKLLVDDTDNQNFRNLVLTDGIVNMLISWKK